MSDATPPEHGAERGATPPGGSPTRSQREHLDASTLRAAGRGRSRSNQSRPANQRTRPANYAARRMLVSTITITAVVLAGVFAFQLLKGDDTSRASNGDAVDWDEIALISRTDGQVTTIDKDGEAVTVFTEPFGRANDVMVAGDRMAIVGFNEIILTSLDEHEPIVIPYERGLEVSRVPVAERLILSLTEPVGGNVLIIDGTTGDVLDIGALAGQTTPRLLASTLRVDAAGTAFAVADAMNSSTIVVRFGQREPEYYPDSPVAISDTMVVTSQTVGPRSDIAIFSDPTTKSTEVPTEVLAGGAIIDGALVAVLADGGIVKIGPDDSAAQPLGSISVPNGATVSTVRLTSNGERLVIGGPLFQSVVEADGSTVFTTTFTAPVGVAAPDMGWSCLPVGGPGAYHSLISLDDGEQLADLTGFELTGASGDGCTIIGNRGTLTQIVAAEGTIDLAGLRSAFIGPDGYTLVQQTNIGRTTLTTIDDDFALGEPVDLSDLIDTQNLTVAFLDR